MGGPEEPNESIHEGDLPHFHREAQFLGEMAETLSSRAYSLAQTIIYNDAGADLSAYRLMLNTVYHVAVLGEQPS